MNNSWMDANTYAAQVRDLRRQNNLSQDELAERAGLSRTYISLIERGQAENITLGALRKIYAALKSVPAQPYQWSARARIADLVEELNETRDCREVAIAITKLEEAGHWLQSAEARAMRTKA